MDYKLREIFFQLLRIGLWQKGKLKLENVLSPSDWSQIYSFATTHIVEGVIYDSFTLLNESQLPPQQLRLQWAVRMDKIERHNIKMNEVIVMQYISFTKQGLFPILQKGQGVAACYNKPLHRISGDIDWYFENNGYAKAREYIKHKNLKFKDTAGFSLDYEWNGINIEHHKRLFDIKSPFKYGYLSKIQDLYKDKQQEHLIKDVSIKILAPELQLLQVNSHILKHMISFGIGLRQICDAARLYANYKNEVDAVALKEIYEKSGILKWVHVLHHILVKHIGLPMDSLPFEYPPDTQSDWMLTEICHGGNFGYYDDRFIDGKINNTVSVHPDGAKRLWSNFKRYLPYAPQEAFFFPIVHLYSKFLGIDND